MKNAEDMSMGKGWECPKCGKVYAPFVRQCDLCSSIGKPLEDAYQKGAEEMRMRAAKQCYSGNGQVEIACDIIKKINALPLHPEGGGR